MSVTQKAACAIFFLHLLGGCNTEGNEEPGDTSSSNSGSVSSSGGPSISEFCAERQHYEGTFSEPPYPLKLTSSGSDVYTINGDFEDSSIAAAIEHNVDPMYVYAGSGSAKLVDREFNASFPGGEQDLLEQSQQVTFWIYSSSDKQEEFRIEAGGQILQSIANDSGSGFSFIDSGTEAVFAVQPHEWTLVSLDVAGAMGNCLSWLKIVKYASLDDIADDPVEFYIDDIQFHLEPQ